MREYNELTKTLLSAGYSAEHYPKDMVHICSHAGADPKNPLDNFYGGFEYTPAYRNTLLYETGCGLFVMGRNVLSGMSCYGKDWTYENFSPLIRCPYDNPACPENDPLLHGTNGGALCIQCWCVCHPTDKAYDYEHSFEKAEGERQAEKERRYQEYAAARNGQVCRNHMYYDERTKEWSLRYDPGDCARLKCTGFCPVLNKELDRKKGNVYYDIRITKQRHDLDGTLFEGQTDTSVNKGIRKFKHPVSMDICRSYVKLCKKDLIRHVMLNEYHGELFFAKCHGHKFSVEVLNIRAMQRESRDLAQDLEDIQNGIKIQHASDQEKRQKAEKSLRRRKAKQDRIRRLEKKLLTAGYDSLEPYSTDRLHADKWLGAERIRELEAQRLQHLKELENVPRQLTMKEFIPMEDTV